VESPDHGIAVFRLCNKSPNAVKRPNQSIDALSNTDFVVKKMTILGGSLEEQLDVTSGQYDFMVADWFEKGGEVCDVLLKGMQEWYPRGHVQVLTCIHVQGIHGAYPPITLCKALNKHANTEALAHRTSQIPLRIIRCCNLSCLYKSFAVRFFAYGSPRVYRSQGSVPLHVRKPEQVLARIWMACKSACIDATGETKN